jgi:hypothetical protein
MVEVAGLMLIDTRVAEVTVRAVLPEIVPEVAVMVVVPAVSAVACPASIAATLPLDEVQLTEEVRSWVVPSE